MSDETYYVRPAFNGGCPRVYHSDPECLHVTERSREINKENVKRRDLTECKVCAGNVECNPTGVKLGENGFDARRYNGSMGIGETDD